MKILFRSGLCFSILILLSACSPTKIISTNSISSGTNPPPQLTVELRDGSRVVGDSVAKNFEFQSALLGKIKLAVKDIRSVECISSNSAKLSVINGDSLMVSFVDSMFAIKTSFGKVDLSVDSVRKISVSAGGAHVRPPGLVALWSGDGDSLDSVSGKTAEMVGGVGYAPGKVGQAFSFEGANSCISIPANDSINFSGNMPMTISTWVFRTGDAPVEHIVGKRNNCYLGNIQYQLAFDETSGLAFVANSGNFWVSTHRQLPMNVWQHLAVTYDGTTATVYINGLPAASGGGTLGAAIAAPLKIGSAGSCQSFGGLIDEVAIYNRALSAAEIQGEYEAGNKN